MTHPAATVFIAALLSPTATMAEPQQEARQMGQPIQQQGQPRQQPEPTLARQRQLLEEMNHEKQLQKQQQPIHFGK